MKKWYTSKTLWVNLVSIVALLLQSVYGKEVLDPASQTAIISVINIILRLVTNAPIEGTKASEIDNEE